MCEGILLDGLAQPCPGRLAGSRRFTGPQATPHWSPLTGVLLGLLRSPGASL